MKKHNPFAGVPHYIMNVLDDCSCSLEEVKENTCSCSGIAETSFVKEPATKSTFAVFSEPKQVQKTKTPKIVYKRSRMLSKDEVEVQNQSERIIKSNYTPPVYKSAEDKEKEAQGFKNLYGVWIKK